MATVFALVNSLLLVLLWNQVLLVVLAWPQVMAANISLHTYIVGIPMPKDYLELFDNRHSNNCDKDINDNNDISSNTTVPTKLNTTNGNANSSTPTRTHNNDNTDAPTNHPTPTSTPPPTLIRPQVLAFLVITAHSTDHAFTVNVTTHRPATAPCDVTVTSHALDRDGTVTLTFPPMDALLLRPMERTARGVVVVSSPWPVQVTAYVVTAGPGFAPSDPNADLPTVESIASTHVLSADYLGLHYTLLTKEVKQREERYSALIISAFPDNEASISLQTHILEKKRTPSLTYNGVHLASLKDFTVSLGQYQAFLLQSVFSLKSSRIAFRHPGAVFIGRQNGSNHDVEQLLPMSGTMTDYVTSFAPIPGVNRFRFVPLKHATLVQVGERFGYLNQAGDFWRMVIYPGVFVTSDPKQPVAAMFYKTDSRVKPVCSSTVIPRRLWRSEYVWSIPEAITELGMYSNVLKNATLRLAVMVPQELRNRLVLDGSLLDQVDDEFTRSGTTYFYVEVSHGRHTISLTSAQPDQVFSALMVGVLYNQPNPFIAFCHNLGLEEKPDDYLFTDFDPFPNPDNSGYQGLKGPPTTQATNETRYSTDVTTATLIRPTSDAALPTTGHNGNETTSSTIVIATDAESTTTNPSADVPTTRSANSTCIDDDTFSTRQPAKPVNVTTGQLMEILQDIRVHLLVDKRRTSKTLRRLRSSPDPRLSSASMGVGGVAICVAISLSIVTSDLIRVGVAMRACLRQCFAFC